MEGLDMTAAVESTLHGRGLNLVYGRSIVS